MATIRNVSLGTITDLRPRGVKRLVSYGIPGLAGSYYQNIESEEREWSVRGFFSALTQAQRDSMEQLKDGGVAKIDFTDLNSILYGWCKVKDVEWIHSEFAPGIGEYRLTLGMVPCIGTMVMLSDDGYIHDLDYQTAHRMVDPFNGRFGAVFSDTVTHVHYMYIRNTDIANTKTLEFETWRGDDLVDVQIDGWKGGAWVLAGRWGAGHTTYGNTVSFTDDDSASHTFRVNSGLRQALLTNFTARLTNYPGNKYHVGVQISGMTAAPATYPVYTKYGQYQLYLKVTMEHATRDAMRSYPVVTYQDGGFGGVPA